MSYAMAYSQVVEAVLPRQAWDETYFSLLSLKSHLQALPGWQRLDFWARDLESGDMKVVIVTNWDHPDQLALWLERGVTADALLRSMEPAPTEINVELYEEIA
jgi:hypothetical protein